jgi:pimeloyl-ACP methyl ester carboxylesterase
MPWVDVNGIDLYYVEEGQGQPLVFLHGMSSCAEAWFQQFAFFRDRYRVIAYDSVNHGHSANSPRDQEEPDRADELQGFLVALGLERPVLIGNSMGGDTILRWAVRHPDSATALVVAGMGILTEGAVREVTPLDPETLFLPTGDSFTEDFIRREPRLYERYLRIRSTATRIEAMRHPRPRARTLADRAALAGRVSAIRSPMLIVVGGRDRLRPNAERLRELVPHAAYHVIEGAPHNAYYERAAEFNAVVDGFLTRVLGTAVAGPTTASP